MPVLTIVAVGNFETEEELETFLGAKELDMSDDERKALLKDKRLSAHDDNLGVEILMTIKG